MFFGVSVAFAAACAGLSFDSDSGFAHYVPDLACDVVWVFDFLHDSYTFSLGVDGYFSAVHDSLD